LRQRIFPHCGSGYTRKRGAFEHKSKNPTVKSGISFFQMLNAARVTLVDQQNYDLSGFHIAATSNIGSQQLLRPARLPFATLERVVLAKLHKHFRPELIW